MRSFKYRLDMTLGELTWRVTPNLREKANMFHNVPTIQEKMGNFAELNSFMEMEWRNRI